MNASKKRGWYVYFQGKDGNGRKIWRVRWYDTQRNIWCDTSTEFGTKKQAEESCKDTVKYTRDREKRIDEMMREGQ